MASLEAWIQGAPTGPVRGSTPTIFVTDSSRNGPNHLPTQTLQSYEVLGEVPGDVPRCYAVRLKFDNPSEVRKDRYVVVGIDPLWIFRHEDYELLSHWEHPMPAAKSDDSAATSK